MVPSLQGGEGEGAAEGVGSYASPPLVEDPRA